MRPLLTLAALAASSTALAQGSCGVEQILSDASADFIRAAGADNADLYGAVSGVERNMLPLMHEVSDFGDNGIKLFVFEQRVVLGVGRAPAWVSGSDCKYGTQYAPVDMGSGNFGLAWTWGDVGLFYNASTAGTWTTSSGAMRGFSGFLGPASVIYYGLAAPFMPAGKTVNDSGAFYWDYIIGAELTPATVAIRAGYVGSSGVYVQGRESTTGLFFGAAANDAFANLPYLRAGLERLAVKKLRETLGFTSPFARRMQLPGAAEAPAKDRQSFTTGHLNQENLDEIIDVFASVAVKPSLFIHEARVGLHTKDWYRRAEDRDQEWSFRGVAGVLQMPEAVHYGAKGGLRPTAKFEADFALDDFGDAFGALQISARYNDPEVTDYFPYAEDALEIYFLMKMGGD
jgi:hypothetical protein